MTVLMPTVDCKPTDAGVFLTPLYGSVSTFVFPSAFYYGSPQAYNSVTFLRNEQLTNLIFPIQLNGNAYGKNFNVALTQYKSCTVTSATPAVVTITTHGYSTGDKVRFSASTIPTGMVAGLQYFVNVQSANTFWIYDTQANAIAGGATGRVNTSSTGTSVVCNKVIEEKVLNLTTIYNDINKDSLGNKPTIYYHSTGWTTVVDTTATKWGFMGSFDDPTATNTNMASIAFSASTLAYGTTTQSATTDVDSFIFSKKIDLSAGWIFRGYSLMTGYAAQDPFLNPKFVVDPTKASIGNITIRASSGIFGGSFSSVMIGKNLKFSSSLTTGSTSATLTSNFDGVSGTYLVQLLSGTETGTTPQVNMTFTNGSTNVTFSALSEDFLDYAVVAMPLSKNYTITIEDVTNGIVMDSSSIETSIVFVGEKYYTRTWTTLDAGIVVGASSLTTKQATGWQINDVIAIGGNLVSAANAGDMTTYTITGISTAGGKDTINFSPNLATYDRAVMGAVTLYRATKNAIKIVRSAGTSQSLLNLIGSSTNFIVANFENEFVLAQIISNSYATNSLTYARRCFYLNIWSAYPSLFLGFKGVTVRNVSATRNTSPGTQEINATLLTVDCYIQDILFLWINSGLTLVKQRAKYNNIRIEARLGAGSQSVNPSTLPSTYVKNIYVWVTNRTAAEVTGFFGQFTGGTFENVYIDGATNAMQISNTPFVLIKNVYFGTIVPNTYDIATLSSITYVDVEFNNIVGNYTYRSAYQKNLASGSKIRITDANGITGNNRVIQTFGETNITGTGLADTTEHNGNPCIKFSSNYAFDTTEWKQTVPTGNIQNKDMMVGIWVNISNANYWAGTHQMPRLTITYDSTTIAYAEAAQVTGLQYIFVPFTPLTTASSVEAKITTQTAATGTDADVYFADYSVLYPAGYTLNLGSFDNYTGGFPTVPTISTSVSAQDVWAADPTQFGASTVGDKVNKIKKIVTGLQ